MTALDRIDPQLLSETDEQRQLRAVLRDFYREASGPEDVREHLGTPRGYDESLWKRLAGEIGVHGLAIPEEYGGRASRSPNWRWPWRSPDGRCTARPCCPRWSSPHTPCWRAGTGRRASATCRGSRTAR